MGPRVVLVTGVSRYLGSRLAAELSADDSVERIIGVDTIAPPPVLARTLGRTEVVQADIRNPLIAKVIARSRVDTVVHMNVIATPQDAGGRTAMKEINVIGTMQLLAACQKAPSLRRLVLRSTTAVYGSSARDPAMFTEDALPKVVPRSGYAKDAVEVEGYVRGFGRRRPDVDLSVLRFTNFVGPRIDTPLTRYLTLPVVPTVLGFDPRLQLCHEDDGIEVLRRMTTQSHPGVFNVGGAGVILLSQAIRRLGRPSVPVLPSAAPLVATAMRRAGVVDVSPEQLRYLEHGRVADVSRLGAETGFLPRPTAAAFEDLAARSGSRRFAAGAAEAVERRVLGLLVRRPPEAVGA